MRDFKNKVAIVTGGASGIGRAIAERGAQEGMKIVLADVEEEALAQTEAEMKATGAAVLAVLTDVSKASDIESLAQKTLDAFGAVHLLCNNAGVGEGPLTAAWENTVADWEWVMGVNLWGVIHGVRIFVPIMLQQDAEGHIVNTASMAGLMSYHGFVIYTVTKHGVVALSETLHLDLARQGGKIRVSVLCPGFVSTRIMDSERNRPANLQSEPAQAPLSPEAERLEQTWRKATKGGISPQQAADCVFHAVRDEKFYILTHLESKAIVQERMENILQNRNPTDALPPQL